jgi:hypothetical protein
VLNDSLFPSIKIKDYRENYDDCWAARFDQISVQFVLTQIDCSSERRIFCYHFPSGLPTFNNNVTGFGGVSKSLDLLLDPVKLIDFKKATSEKRKQVKEIFSRIDIRASYDSLVSTLWDSAIPCFDLKDITSHVNGEKSILKTCIWKGKQLPCSSIFTKVATDEGLCCAFNSELADKILNETAYSNLITDLQKKDSSYAFANNSKTNWYSEEKEPKSIPGIAKGLTLILDAHTDLLAASSVASDFKGFFGLITGKGDYPMVYSNGFLIRPGHTNFVALSASMIEADNDLRSLEPWRRKCIFNDETQNLTLHREYSQAKWNLECALHCAHSETLKKFNTSCIPWHFPTKESNPRVCDPWMAKFFRFATFSAPQSECDHCLPSCSVTYYRHSVTSSPFRQCDDLNIGLSYICKLDGKKISDPKIWANQIISKYGKNPPKYISRIVTNRRKFLSGNDSILSIVPADYDAYEEDIAVVSVFFESPAVFLYRSQHSQTWIDFFSAIGGLLGVCFGFSFVTIAELIWLCIHLGKLTLVETPGNKKPVKLANSSMY